jgi:hypothetical protein
LERGKAAAVFSTNGCQGNRTNSVGKYTLGVPIATSDAPDTGLAQSVLPQRSSGNTFCFFAFADAQCRKRQNLPLKFAEFMDGRKISEAILRETSSRGPPYEFEVYYDGEGNVSSKKGWPRFAEDHDLHQGWFLIFNYHCGTAKFKRPNL